jgi:predicted Rossmann fold nucleotide-binding protein DprA/Smf involved in DNA uptake
MRVGIVGSRRRLDKENIIAYVETLGDHDIVVSGGCWGVDTWAEECAKERGLETRIFKPDLRNTKDRADVVNRYYERNKKIVENSDIIIAFVSEDRTGGTENTIKWANELGVPVILR